MEDAPRNVDCRSIEMRARPVTVIGVLAAAFAAAVTIPPK
jgi:hypothetical protein